ncbi:MAG: hypothetical protein RIT45_5 [Pseudomonadota bacterium]
MCVGGAQQLCGCASDGDCAGFDDDDICNGSYACKDGACIYDGKALKCDFDYVAFCDASSLSPIGKATKLANGFQLTHGKETDAGALWFKTPLVPASFSSSFVVAGFAAAWSFVLQATASQDQLSAGSVADNTPPLSTSAIGVRVEGELNQPSKLTIYAGGVKVAEQPNALTWTQTQSVQRFWVDADYVNKTVSVYVGDTKPATALLSGRVYMGKVPSTQSQPMIVGFTAGNSAAAFRTKSLISWWGKHN